MNNIHLHIFGSKVFFNLIEELNFEYKSIFEKNNTSIIENNFSNNEIRIVFVEGLKLTDLKIFFKQKQFWCLYILIYVLIKNQSLK